MADMHASTRSKQQHAAEQRVKRAGYAHGGRVHSAVPADDEKQDKPKLRLRRGGQVTGQKAQRRTDKGGRGHGDLTLVIQNSNPGERQQAAQKGMQMGAVLGAKKAAASMAGAPHPASAGPPGMPPGGAPPVAAAGAPMLPRSQPGMPPRPQMVRRGGKVKTYVEVRAHKRRRAGGAV